MWGRGGLAPHDIVSSLTTSLSHTFQQESKCNGSPGRLLYEGLIWTTTTI